MLGQVDIRKTSEFFLGGRKQWNVDAQSKGLTTKAFCSNFASYKTIEFQDEVNKRAAKELKKKMGDKFEQMKKQMAKASKD